MIKLELTPTQAMFMAIALEEVKKSEYHTLTKATYAELLEQIQGLRRQYHEELLPELKDELFRITEFMKDIENDV